MVPRQYLNGRAQPSVFLIIRVEIIIGRDGRLFDIASDVPQRHLPSDPMRFHDNCEHIDPLVRERLAGALGHAVARGNHPGLPRGDDVPPIRVHSDGYNARVVSPQLRCVIQPKSRPVQRAQASVGRARIMRFEQIVARTLRLQGITRFGRETEALRPSRPTSHHGVARERLRPRLVALPAVALGELQELGAVLALVQYQVLEAGN